MADAPTADIPTPAIVQLEVTNGLDYPIQDMFDGIPVRFPVGEKVVITPEMAQHLFGYPGEARDMALHMAKRFGWSGVEYLLPAGGHGLAPFEVMAAKITIEPVYYDLVQRPRNAPIPADPGDDEGAAEPQEPPDDGATKVGRRKRPPSRTGAPRAPAARKTRQAAKAGGR